MKTEMMNRAGEAAGKIGIFAGGASAAWGWLTLEQVFSFLGFLIALAGVLVSWYYKRESERREARAAAQRASDAQHAAALRDAADARAAREAALREQWYQLRIEHLRHSASAAVLAADNASDPASQPGSLT